MDTLQIDVSALQPNEWNPNKMTDDEFAEFVAEVEHLGCVPKPVVVRPGGAGYEIIDGEHAWRAAVQLQHDTVTCEVIDADDFEAMRQTYKRNQHGTHEPVAEGRMFRRMLEERGVSNRALAELVSVSESKIRTGLMYAEAADQRPDFNFSELSVRQVRQYAHLPQVVGDAWIDGGADLEITQHDFRPLLFDLSGKPKVVPERVKWTPEDDEGTDGALKMPPRMGRSIAEDSGIPGERGSTRFPFERTHRPTWVPCVSRVCTPSHSDNRKTRLRAGRGSGG
jgi:ParB/RepB/Spo0J family partition protein